MIYKEPFVSGKRKSSETGLDLGITLKTVPMQSVGYFYVLLVRGMDEKVAVYRQGSLERT